LLTASIAHFVVREPSPILVLMPTEADCRDYTVSDLEPLFLDSQDIADHLPMPHPGRSDHRLFPGGSLKIVATKAPRNLRRHTARCLLIDEVDACEASAEGDPVALAEKRPTQSGATDEATRRTKGGCKPDVGQGMRGACLSWTTIWEGAASSHRYTISTFWPSIKPVSLRPCRNKAAINSPASGEPVPRYPITGTAGCCPRAATGHTAAPPSPAINSRRRISALQRFVGKPIAIRDALEPLLMAAPGRSPTTGAFAPRPQPAKR
jgi:hypothetical protein